MKLGMFFTLRRIFFKQTGHLRVHIDQSNVGPEAGFGESAHVLVSASRIPLGKSKQWLGIQPCQRGFTSNV